MNSIIQSERTKNGNHHLILAVSYLGLGLGPSNVIATFNNLMFEQLVLHLPAKTMYAFYGHFGRRHPHLITWFDDLVGMNALGQDIAILKSNGQLEFRPMRPYAAAQLLNHPRFVRRDANDQIPLPIFANQLRDPIQSRYFRLVKDFGLDMEFPG